MPSRTFFALGLVISVLGSLVGILFFMTQSSTEQSKLPSTIDSETSSNMMGMWSKPDRIAQERPDRTTQKTMTDSVVSAVRSISSLALSLPELEPAPAPAPIHITSETQMTGDGTYIFNEESTSPVRFLTGC